MADNSIRTPGAGEEIRSLEAAGGEKTQVLVINRSGDPDAENLGEIGTPVVSSAAPTNAASSMLAANANRKVALMRNAGTMTIYFGTSAGVTTANGWPVQPGETLVDDRTGAQWFGIVASGVGALRTIEVS